MIYNINLFFREIGDCFNELNINPDCRVIVLSANGPYFTAGKVTLLH